MKRWIAVISDLHLSDGPLDDFDAELESHLVDFLYWLGTRDEPAELVVNGDFLDFAQASPWAGADLESGTDEGIPLCFSEVQSAQKFTAIRAAHARAFAGLRDFLAARPDNRVVVLPGNHDADFFWPAVGQAVRAAAGAAQAGARLELCLARHYRPPGCEWLWIEHGHQYDPVNSFFVGGEERWSVERPPVFAARDGLRRLLECTGTRFLVRFLNRLDARYPYVDNVKPFSRFLRIFGASALTPGWGPLDAAVSVTQMLAYLAKTAVVRPTDLLGVEDLTGAALPHPLSDWVKSAPAADRQRLTAGLRDRGYRLAMPLDMLLERPDEAARLLEFLAAQPDLLDGLGERDAALLGASGGTLKLAAGFRADETEDLYAGACAVAAREKVSAVVMGHTHERVDRREGFTYFNTGSWTRYYRFEEKERTQPWRVLRERSHERFPYRLCYALVRPGAAQATLEAWRESPRP
jgi:UDP-2,3-diacylglucosamine pyrophosphatase LpxH